MPQAYIVKFTTAKGTRIEEYLDDADAKLIKTLVQFLRLHRATDIVVENISIH